MLQENIDALIEQLKTLKKYIKSKDDTSIKLLDTEDQKTRSKLNAKIMMDTYAIRNQERKVWHTMQDFQVSLEPEQFYTSSMHVYELWTPYK